MAKRPNPRAIKAARTYTVEEAANALGVSIGTIRSWVKSGLPLMKSQRPFLILGDALRGFLEVRAKAAKAPLQPDQLYCLSCKAGRTPMGLMVDCIPQTPKTARLLGLCEVCGGTCNRMISQTKIDHFSRIFEIAIKEGRQA
ncbi:MAG: helix-turn-helix domain-containing protein [Rhodobacteraceae bacterium]|nr:helix-turn-helix domain-containing protein [Paracoccaceae bacterium]